MTKEIVSKIRVFGNEILTKKARGVSEVSSDQREILSRMAQIMYESQGIGLAAPQIGIGECLAVIDIGSGLYKLINPKIIKKHGQQVLEEGCLSVPGVYVKIKRAKYVCVLAQDEFGKPVTIEAEDLLACVLQHEIDHLKGKLIVDYAPFLQKLKIKRKLTELKKKSKDEELSESKTKSCKLQL